VDAISGAQPKCSTENAERIPEVETGKCGIEFVHFPSIVAHFFLLSFVLFRYSVDPQNNNNNNNNNSGLEKTYSEAEQSNKLFGTNFTQNRLGG